MKKLYQFILENLDGKITSQDLELGFKDGLKRKHPLFAFLRKFFEEKLYNYGTSSKHTDEIFRANFETTSEFKQSVINNIFKRFSDFDENNVINTEFPIEQSIIDKYINSDKPIFIITNPESNVSSGDYYSVEICIIYKGYKDKFFITNRGSNKKGQKILLPSNKLMPSSLNITSESNSYEDILGQYEAKKRIDDGIDNVFDIDSNENKLLHVLIDNMPEDETSNKSDDIHLIDIKPNNKELISYFKETLDDTSIKNINKCFSEIIAGYAFLKYDYKLDNKRGKFVGVSWPKDVTNAMVDFYVYDDNNNNAGNKYGISVKSQSASMGHKPSITTISKKLSTSMIDINHSEQVKDNGKNKELQNKFLKVMSIIEDNKSDLQKMYFILAENIFDPNGERIKAYNILTDKIFGSKENLKNYLKNKYSSSNIEEYSNNIYDLYSEDKSKYLTLLGQLAHGRNEQIKLKDDPIEAKNPSQYHFNYSKFMICLLWGIIERLNELFCNENNINYLTANLYDALSGKLQSYVTVVFPEDSETIRIKIKTESMEIQNYKFTHGGATGNDWNNHGGISFMVTKKLEKLS